jgi:hypothetical protein
MASIIFQALRKKVSTPSKGSLKRISLHPSTNCIPTPAITSEERRLENVREVSQSMKFDKEGNAVPKKQCVETSTVSTSEVSKMSRPRLFDNSKIKSFF